MKPVNQLCICQVRDNGIVLAIYNILYYYGLRNNVEMERSVVVECYDR